MKKQLLLLVLFLLPMVASAYDIEVQNADGKTIYYNYTNDGKELEVTEGGYSGNIVIPEEVTFMNRTRKVTSIGDDAFYGCTGLTSITIPNSVTSIGGGAFYQCIGLTSITIPNSVTSIGGGAFYQCISLTSITIPNGVTSIGSGAFRECTGLTSITIPNSVTSIGSGAFRECTGLTSITIPNSVTSIGDETFDQCYGLTSVTIGNSVTSIGEYAFSYCGNLTTITIGNSVTSIGNYAFNKCSNLTKVIISDIAAWCGVKFKNSSDNPLSLAKHLYSDENTEIKDLVIPNGVTSISNWAFYGCYGLTSVTIGNSVTRIGIYAFCDCSSLTSVTIGNSVTSIDRAAFYDCSGLTSVTIGSDVTSIGECAFYGADIPTIISLIENPFWIYGLSSDHNHSTFTLNTFKNATLYVPVGTIEKYKATEGWKDFVFIEESDLAGINVVENTQNNNTTIYDLNGVRLSEPKKGINILNGKKVVVK